MSEKIFEPLLSVPNIHRIDIYEAKNGYSSLVKALSMDKEEIIEEVKKANLRGRGGAGFPAGVKWGFMPKGKKITKYLVVNADEGEPGTFKDKYIISKIPHLLIEGIIITSYALDIKKAFIYIRGEYEKYAKILEQAIEEAKERGYLGKNILGKRFSLDIVVYRGAGAYVCGEETALLESLEGKRGQPRIKPPFPAQKGLYGKPTLINNVETIACIPAIVKNGGFWFASLGTQKNGGTKLFAVSGKVKKPGIYELPMGTNLKDLIYKYAGGIVGDKKLKAVIPGGISAPILKADEIDLPLDNDSLMKAGSMLGSGAVMVFSEDDRIIEMMKIAIDFYHHESCGQCTPCRMGTNILKKLIHKIYNGKGKPEDVENIIKVSHSIKGKTLCPFGDAVSMAIGTMAKKFKEELLSEVEEKAQ